ncbi:MAG: hypothetical protein PHP42_04110, partial [Bacteroidota bacterium]|nr:hypothetical protein [Bacteroidota bacterium]
MKSFTIFSVITFVAAVTLYGCSDTAPSDLPKSDLGSNTVSKYVAIGNSLTAGYQSGALFEDGQTYSFPNLVARQLKMAGAPLGNFEQPIWGNPGNYGANGKSARMEILGFYKDPTTGQILPSIGSAGLTPGVAKNLNLQRVYDNLGIPGAKIGDFFDTTDFIAKSTATFNPFYAHVLRSAAFGKNTYQQAKSLSPDLITFWLANNDVL